MFKDLYYWYDHTAAGMGRWWTDTALEVATNPDIDGVFLDKVLGKEGPFFDAEGAPATDYIDMMSTLYRELPSDKLLIGNTLRNERYNGNREHMRYMDGSYMERWDFFNRDIDPNQSTVEALHVSIQLMREALAKGKGKGKMNNLQTGPGSSDVETPVDATEEAMKAYYEEALPFPLAVFLIIAEENAHFSYQGSVNAREDSWKWNTSWTEEFSRPLGAPLGKPLRDGDVYTRSFTYLDVELNVDTKTTSLTWK